MELVGVLPEDLLDGCCRLLDRCRIVSSNTQIRAEPSCLLHRHASVHSMRICMRADVDDRRTIGRAGSYDQRERASIRELLCRCPREKVAHENAGNEVVGHDTLDLSASLCSYYTDL